MWRPSLRLLIYTKGGGLGKVSTPLSIAAMFSQCTHSVNAAHTSREEGGKKTDPGYPRDRVAYSIPQPIQECTRQSDEMQITGPCACQLQLAQRKQQAAGSRQQAATSMYLAFQRPMKNQLGQNRFRSIPTQPWRGQHTTKESREDSGGLERRHWGTLTSCVRRQLNTQFNLGPE